MHLGILYTSMKSSMYTYKLVVLYTECKIYNQNAMHVSLDLKASAGLKYLFLSITASKGSEGTTRCQRATQKLHRRNPFVDRGKLPTTSRSQIPEAVKQYQIITNDQNN